MIESIRSELGVTSLKYLTINEMIKAIGLPRQKLCLYCCNGQARDIFMIKPKYLTVCSFLLEI